MPHTTPASQHYLYQGLSLNYRDAGPQTAPVVVMLSGWGFGSLMGEAALADLRTQQLRLITLDVPGTGTNQNTSAFVHISRLARGVAALLRELEIHEAILVGHSFGSMIAQEMAMSEDDVVGKLILVSALPGIGGMVGDLSSAMQVLNRLMSGTKGLFQFLYTPTYLAHLKETLGEVFEGLDRPASSTALSGQVWAASRWTNLGRIQQIYQPTLIIHGETDPLSFVGHANLLAAQLPQAELEILPCGYLPFVEQKDKTLKLIRDFVA